MTRSEIFSTAHAIAKSQNSNDYRSVFACALVSVYARLRAHGIRIEAGGSKRATVAAPKKAKQTNDNAKHVEALNNAINHLKQQKEYKENYINNSEPNTKTSASVCRSYANRQRKNHRRVHNETISAFKMDVAEYDRMIIKHTTELNKLCRTA